MAELPEVETMRRDLEREVVGRRIERTTVAQTRMLGGQAAGELVRRTEGTLIRSVGRRGKYLYLQLDSTDALFLHRGMTGNLFLRRPADPPDAHLHLALTLDDGRQLRACDPRGFGEIRAVSPAEVQALDQRLGPEPLSPAFSAEYLAARLAPRSALVKALLLNQSFIAGLGNIYTDEALWAARVHPARRACTLAPHEVQVLHGAIVELLAAAIERRGTTFRDYKDLYGRPGGNSSYLRVFHRADQPCLRCGEPILIMRAAGRGSSICPACQRVGDRG